MVLLGSDVAAMAPLSIIGSAQPVRFAPTGSEPINDSKTINAIVALIEEKAAAHDRNQTAAGRFVTSGILAVAGLICVIVGSILFVPTSFPDWYVPAGYQRSMTMTIVLPSLILGVFLALAIYKVAKARFAPPVLGRVEGQEAVALDRFDREGYVIFEGEYWLAMSDEPVEKGEKVLVAGKDGSRLMVKKKKAEG